MTETFDIVLLENQYAGPKHRIGRVCSSGVEALIVNVDKLKPLPPGQLGETWACGPNMTQGYFNNPQATRQTIDEDWVHTSYWKSWVL